jgi:hypothetical protein
MKKIFLLAAILLSTQAQAARLQCDLENVDPKNQTHYHFTLDVNEKRVKVAEGYSSIARLDVGDGVPVTMNWEVGIVASSHYQESNPERYSTNLRLNRHSLRLSVFTIIGGTERLYKGQCYESDPKF